MHQDEETETRIDSIPREDITSLSFPPSAQEFLKAETGIQDSEELRKHVSSVQEDTYKIFPYPCVRLCRFGEVAINPFYPRALELVKNRPDAIFLDLACCMGSDLRRIVRDGWPLSQTIATDIEAGFWDSGHKLFRTTPETYPAKFIAGNAFDDGHICPTAPVPSSPPPSLASVNTLTELRGRISVIHATYFFHLFDEEKKVELAKRVASLLDLRPGSIIFGSDIGLPNKGEVRAASGNIFCHSPETWTEIWDGRVFEKGKVKVTTGFKEITTKGMEDVLLSLGGARLHWLPWCVEVL